MPATTIETSHMATIFTRIIQGEIPCHKLYEDSLCFAFLDINPINPGHTLVISREETDYLFDLDDDLLKHMMGIAKKIREPTLKKVLSINFWQKLIMALVH